METSVRGNKGHGGNRTNEARVSGFFFLFFYVFFFPVVFLIVVLMCVEQFGSCFASVLVKLISLTYLTIKSESYL